MFIYIRDKKIICQSDVKQNGITFDREVDTDTISGNIEYSTIIINKEFQETYKAITSGYLPEEIVSWDYQMQEAKNVHGGGNSDFLNKMLKDGETITELKDKILSNETLFKNAFADALKIKRDKLEILNNI